MPNIDDEPGWLDLLSSLSDEELAKYGEIVVDQAAIEWQRAAAQVVCAIAALSLTAASLYLGLAGAATRTALATGALGLGVGYWPWRKARTRRLWKTHHEAVAREKERRDFGAG
ncbi:MAG: hypothetical protein AAFO62_04960 [Pseudomonadota bacterium]